jgi:hypothetical protein
MRGEQFSTSDAIALRRRRLITFMSGRHDRSVGRELEHYGITRTRIVAGKIIESWTEWDRLGVVAGLLEHRCD